MLQSCDEEECSLIVRQCGVSVVFVKYPITMFGGMRDSYIVSSQTERDRSMQLIIVLEIISVAKHTGAQLTVIVNQILETCVYRIFFFRHF